MSNHRGRLTSFEGWAKEIYGMSAKREFGYKEAGWAYMRGGSLAGISIRVLAGGKGTVGIHDSQRCGVKDEIKMQETLYQAPVQEPEFWKPAVPLDRVFQAALDSACTFCQDRNLTSMVKGKRSGERSNRVLVVDL